MKQIKEKIQKEKFMISAEQNDQVSESLKGRLTEKLRSRSGMTLAELLMVVGIVIALAAVAFLGIVNYQRSLAQLERDGIAKEIFVAAQNHLSSVAGQGYLQASDSGETESSSSDIYYYVVNGGDKFGSASTTGTSVLSLMLPFGSIDETVRLGGSYVIRYQKSSGTIMDVFYCSTSGSPTQFNHSLTKDEYETLLGLASSDKKDARRTYTNNSVLGWYGGATALSGSSVTLENPTIKVTNAEKLTVTVTDPNYTSKTTNKSSLRLLITGTISGVSHYVDIYKESSTESKTTDSSSSTITLGTADSSGQPFEIVLDDITTTGTESGHFCNRVFDDMTSTSSTTTNSTTNSSTASNTGTDNTSVNLMATNTTDNKFIPGEDLEIQAVAYSLVNRANIAYSEKKTANSLFAMIGDSSDSDDIPDTALISNIRHLENLDAVISNLDANDSGKLSISAASQTANLIWNDSDDSTDDFVSAIKGTNTDAIAVYSHDGKIYTSDDCYMPISPDYALSYDGGTHNISGVTVYLDGSTYKNTVEAGDAGLFGDSSTVGKIENLMLVDFKITGTTAAGALGGKLNNANITNVMVRNTDTTDSQFTNSTTGGTSNPNIQATAGDAGGLVGDLNGGDVNYSAASVVVNGTGNAGGLIGTVNSYTSGSTTISTAINGCYSGGHTDLGEYYEHDTNGSRTKNTSGDYNYIYNVIGSTNAGGLVGYFGSTEITKSYSTCSAYGAVAGGLVGTTTSSSISNCYAAGLTVGSTTSYSFVGSGTVSGEGNYYYSIVNEVTITSGTTTAIDYKLSGPQDSDANSSPAATALDSTAATYETFVGAEANWEYAGPYDATIRKYYGGKYNLRNIAQLDTTFAATAYDDYYVRVHYGDWPAPEIFVINTAG